MTQYKYLNDCRSMGTEQIIDTILYERGIKNKKEFLTPFKKNLHPLLKLKNIDKASQIILSEVEKNSKIGILFDTDLDGISSGSIMFRYLSNFTKNIIPFINKDKQHGLKGQDLNRFKEIDLLIIVDSLDSDCSSYEKLKQDKIKIVILDHHIVKDDIPYQDYVTLVSSQIDYPNPALSGSGVVWKVCKYLDKLQKTKYADELVDLAACGIVADMSDLSENSMENRYIVNLGFKKVINPMIKKIIGSFPFNSTAISFSIAPLINAANRMGENEIAMNGFIIDDNKEILRHLKILKNCKEKQNEEVENLLPSLLEQCESQKNNNIIYLFIETEYGISGLIGNKLLNVYKKPIFILQDKDRDNIRYSGSVRAIGIENFNQLCNDTLLAEANGHESAFGISIKKDDFEEFKTSLDEQFNNHFEIEKDNITYVDAIICLKDINRFLVDKIKEVNKISGTGFPSITFLIKNIDEYIVGNMSQGKHLVINPRDDLQIIKWNWTGDFDEMEELSFINEPLIAVGTLDSGFLGRSFKLKVICDEIGCE